MAVDCSKRCCQLEKEITKSPVLKTQARCAWPRKAVGEVSFLCVLWAFPVLGLQVLSGCGEVGMGASRVLLGLSRMDTNQNYYHYDDGCYHQPRDGTVWGQLHPQPQGHRACSGVLDTGAQGTPGPSAARSQ